MRPRNTPSIHPSLSVAPLLILLSLVASTPAFAGSIRATAPVGTPDSGAATPDTAAVFYNPAAIAPMEGGQIFVDASFAFIGVEIETTRNGGIDPNTLSPYEIAKGSAMVPVFLAGGVYKIVPDRLAIGFMITDPFVGGGDYSGGEPELDPPFELHQRYAGVQTTILTIATSVGFGLTIVDGVHVGGSLAYSMDSIKALQASDPFGTEGMGLDGTPYATDSTLEIDGGGGHLFGTLGAFVDVSDKAQVGLSWTSPSTFKAKGEGTVTVPDALGGVAVPALFTFDMPMPTILRGAIVSQLSEKVKVGAQIDYFTWYGCCGDHEGDVDLKLTNEAGNAIGPDDGVVLELAEQQYIARRLWNNTDLSAFVGYQVHEDVFLGFRAGWNQYAVPDYAVSATNLDFTSVGGTLGGRYAIAGGPVTVGFAYSKYFPFTREITTSGWDVRDEEDEYYVDEYLSPALPYKAGGNGTYSAKSDIFAFRLQADF